MDSMTLTIGGMSCSHCLNAVNRALAALPGVKIKGVQVGRAEVLYEPSEGAAERIVAAVEQAGYTVVASSTPAPYRPPAL